MTWRGMTLLEMMVATALAAVVGTVGVRMLVQARRAWIDQMALADGAAVARTGATLLRDELRELGRDSLGADLVRLDPGSAVYRAVRQMSFLCATPPDTGAGVVVLEPGFMGLRELDPAVDSMLVYSSLTGEGWRAVGVRTGPGTGLCADGSSGRAVETAGAAPLVGLRAGDPVRVFETVEIRRYRDGRGRWWLGMRRARAGRPWPSIQPVVGPLTPGGLELVGRDAAGVPSTDPARLVSVDVRVSAVAGRGRSRERWLPVALRNVQ